MYPLSSTGPHLSNKIPTKKHCTESIWNIHLNMHLNSFPLKIWLQWVLGKSWHAYFVFCTCEHISFAIPWVSSFPYKSWIRYLGYTDINRVTEACIAYILSDLLFVFCDLRKLSFHGNIWGYSCAGDEDAYEHLIQNMTLTRILAIILLAIIVRKTVCEHPLWNYTVLCIVGDLLYSKTPRAFLEHPVSNALCSWFL